jgi:PAS domain S-box-containing protein
MEADDDMDECRRIFEDAPAGIAVVDSGLCLIRSNPALREMLGAPEEELAGRPLDDWARPDDPAAWSDGLARTVSGASPGFNAAGRLVRPDSRPVHAELAVSRMGGPDGRLVVSALDVTERILAERALRERFGQFFDGAKDFLFVSDSEGRILEVNAAASALSGYTREELKRLHIRELYHAPEDRERLLAELCERGTINNYETRGRRKDGSVIDVLVKANVIRDAAGKVTGFLGSLQDITGRRDAERALQASEERLRILYENATIGIYRTTPDGRILLANPALVRMLGYRTFEDLAGRDLNDDGFEPDYPRAGFRERIERDGSVEGLESAWRRRDGSVIHVRESARLIRDNAGRTLYYDGFAEDISDRKRAEEVLRLSEEKFSRIFQVSPQMLAISDLKDGRFVDVNDLFLETVGYERSEVIGRTAAELGLFVDPGQRDEALRILSEKGCFRNHEALVRNRNGETRSGLLSGSLLDLENGRFLLTTLIDVSDLKRSEAALRTSEARLSGFMDSALDGIFLLDSGLRFVQINRRAAELLNRRREEVIGRSVVDILPAGFDPGRFARFGEVIRTGEPVEVEDAVRHPVFGDMHFIVKAFKVGDGLGLIAHEITGRVEAERALARSERRFRALIENSTDAIALLDSAGRVLYHSPSHERIMGYSSQSRFMRDTFELIHPEDAPTVRVLFERILTAPGRIDLPPVRVRHADGTWRWIEGVANNLLDEPAVAALVINFRDVTERKTTERALAHSHDLMRYIIEHNRSAVAVHDRDMRYVYVSQRYLDEYGVKEQDVIGRHHYDVFPDLPRKWREVHRRVLRGEVLSAEDDPYVREDGTVDRTRWECRPWHEADGSIGGLIVYTEIITERKRSEEALRESEERFRRMFQFSAAGMVLVGMDGRFNQVNHAFCRMLGYSESELKTLRFLDVTHPDDVAPSDAMVGKLVSGELESFQFEKRYRRKDGSAVWGLVSSTLIRDSNGKPLHFVTQIQDITDRKRIEVELRRRESLLQESQKTARMGHFVWDAAADRAVTSKTLDEVLGIGPDFPRTVKGWMGLLHPDERKRYRDALTPGNLKGMKSFETIFRIRRPKDRKNRWIRGIGNVELDGSGAVTGLFGTLQDVTEQKLAEERIQADLLEKETLLKEIHHRVKNNLQVISSMLALQSKSIRDPELQDVFQSCRNRVHSIGLVHEKLYRSKSLNSVDFGEYTRTLLREMLITCNREGRVAIKTGVRSVQLDIETAVPVGLILSELVTNALKHAFPGGRRGTLRVDFRAYRQRFWRMTVSDDGVGMPRTKARPANEGFGMELIRILTEQLGGKLLVRRAKGAAFAVTFPKAGP